jgi:hypothetical protein
VSLISGLEVPLVDNTVTAPREHTIRTGRVKEAPHFVGMAAEDLRTVPSPYVPDPQSSIETGADKFVANAETKRHNCVLVAAQDLQIARPVSRRKAFDHAVKLSYEVWVSA